MNIPKRYRKDRYIVGVRAGKIVARANFILDEEGNVNLNFPEDVNFSHSFWQGFYCYLVYGKKIPIDKIKINGTMNDFSRYTQSHFTESGLKSRISDFIPIFDFIK